MKKTILLLPILAGILFGSAGVFVRTFTEAGMNNPTVIFLRTSTASLLLFAFILRKDRTLLKIRRKDLIFFIGTGLIGMLGLNLCYNQSINLLSLSLAAVLLSTAPVFVLIIAAFVFREKVTSRKICGVLLAIVGCVLASGLLEQSDGMKISSTGILLGICAAVFYALYSIFSRMASDKGYHTYTIIFYSVFLITIVLLPFADYAVISSYVSEAPLTSILFLLLHALCTSVLPYICITYALHLAEAGIVSILASGGEPIAAVVFGLLIYAEIPSLLMLAGLALVIFALVLLCRTPASQGSGSQ